ncbi:aminotransferase [Pseudoneurospora amorphoporcata]|uniref:Aminotransferase n=1 Tax=Pseudoneurospora amorphoporcata TaxID=241081 RepID=A0AAN6P3M9_9PEZI|nr:aminotransferase [Pseudoneurospora amorphoporcata]
MATNTDAPLLLFTTLRYDPHLLLVSSHNTPSSALYMLPYHRDRILRAATHFKWPAVVSLLSGDSGLETLSSFIFSSLSDEQLSRPNRIRVTVSEKGKLGITISPVPEVPSTYNLFPFSLPVPGTDVPVISLVGTATPFEVVVDNQESKKSAYTHFKTTKRQVYDEARKRHGIALTDRKEVLLVSEEGEVMEGSIATPYFWRDGRWVTPPVRDEEGGWGSGGNEGTTRRWALERGIAVEEVVLADSLVDGEECWLSNGGRGFYFGKVKLSS